MEATMLFVALTSLILLAVTSMRFGADSREEFASKERELALRGIGREEPATTRRRQRLATGRLPLSTSRLVVPRKCVSAACGA
jgi:hypothetical protein